VSRSDRPAPVPRTVVAPGASGPGGTTSGPVLSRRRATRAAAAVLAGGLVGGLGGTAMAAAAPVAAPAATTSSTGAGALQVRRTNDSAQTAVELAVVPPAGRKAGPIRVVQGGRELSAKTEPLVSAGTPLGIVVQVQPGRLAQAQALVGDALAELPLDARVAVAPLTASATPGSGTGAPAGPQDPSTALSDLFRLAAEPSASALASTSADLTARAGARALLVLTTCPGSERPDVGSGASTAWVLGWGAGCRDAGPRTSSGQLARKVKDLPAALDALPAVLAQMRAARSVRVEPQGVQPLVVRAAGEQATVALAGSSGGSGAGAAEALARSGGAPAASVQPGSPWWQGLPARLGLGVLAAAALLVAIERRRRRPAVARVPAPRRPASPDDPWGRLVPEWTRTRPRSVEPEASAPSGELSDAALPGPVTGPVTAPGSPTSNGRPGVIDLREPAQERPEVRRGPSA
jgi:hypothetical protein